MNKFSNNSNDLISKDIYNFQNNYYKEDKILSINSKIKNDAISNQIKSHSISKNKYKVTYANSILENNNNNNMNANYNIYKNLGNKNILTINNKRINNSIGNIKEINYYTNHKNYNYNNNNNKNITSQKFYNKKINEILSGENNNMNNNKSNNTNSNTDSNNNNNNNNNLINKTHSIIHNTSHTNINNGKNNNIKTVKKSSSKKKNFKIIYANKRPSVPIGNKKYKNNIVNRNKSKKKDDKEKTSKTKLNKIALFQNKKQTKNTPLMTENNLMPASLKYKIESSQKKKSKTKGKKSFQEIKKSQSQSYFKYKLNNNDLNTTNKSKSKSKKNYKNDKSYKGIIIEKKNILKYNIIKSTSHNSTSKKNPMVCINYKNKIKNKYINNSNTKNNSYNKINNNNFNYFMNNLPEEYNKNKLFLEIKNLWNKLKVSYSYQEMFITLTKQMENKKQIFTNEINSLSLILNNLNKLNSDIQTRNSIIDKIKQYKGNGSNNLDEIKNLLISLRMISIDVVHDYIIFIKEISYDVLKNKFNLETIKNFNSNYLNIMKNDTNFLYNHTYLNKIFNFSNQSDPFLIYPSVKRSNNENKYKYTLLPIDDETLEKVHKCLYILLTEKICEYSMCNSKNNINYLLFNDQDNFIHNLINSNSYNDIFNDKNEKNNNDINNSYTINQNSKNISPFTTPNNKAQNIISNINTSSNNANKYDKYRYINNKNNSKNNEIMKNEEIIQNNEYDNLINNNQLNENINNNINDIENNYNNNFSRNESNKNNNSIINNSNGSVSSPIKEKVNIEDIIIKEKNISENNKGNNIGNNNINNDVGISPYIPAKDKSLPSLYSSYLSSVSENIKQSFNINEDIFYYSNIGIYPKIVLFKDNKDLSIKGVCTMSFNQTINSTLSLNKKILTVTSISCSNDYKISQILLNLIDFCKNEEIIYDSIEVNLYYIKKDDGKFLLDENLENEIKSGAKFKWVRLENDGEKRKIKYHYIPNNIIFNKENSIINNLNMNNLDMNCNKCAVYLSNHVLNKYYQDNGINDISMVEHIKLFFIIYLLKKYFLLNNINTNIEQDIQNILINLKGLKLKKIVRLLSEYNNVLLTNSYNFQNDYLNNDSFNTELLNYFLDIIEKNQNQNANNNICLNFNNICTNFSNIIKIELDGYEYNIISMNDFIIEVFNISSDNTNDKDVIYFTKSEIENISFIFYEQSNDNNDNNNTDENNIKLLFNKILKKILVKDSDKPIKSYKKLGIPSFSYQKEIIEDKDDDDKLKIIEYDMLDGKESFDFCIENIPNNKIKFSFPLDKNYVENDDIKIIKNNFVVAVLNPDLVLDYHLPSMNIYYINKDFWTKVKNQ